MKSHFESKLDDMMQKIAIAAMSLGAGDSHGLARLQGRYQALGDAIVEHRKAIRADIDDPDDDAA